ncbi:hypothetical protein ACU686_41990 [Yinghuangia aomiensis]
MLEQLDLLGEEVIPVLRKEFAKGRPADVPDARRTPRVAAGPAARTENRTETETVEVTA